MVTTVFLAFGLLCHAQSQLCGPGGAFPGLLGLENGFFGPGLQFGPLAQNCAAGNCGQPGSPCGAAPCTSPACGAPVACGREFPQSRMSSQQYGIQASGGVQGPPCGISAPPYGTQAPCGVQGSPCSLQVPQCEVQVSQSGIQVPPCGIQAPPCAIQVPPCGIQVPPCGQQVPPCGVQVPSCGTQVPQSVIQAPIINNIAPTLIPNQPCGQCSSFIPNQQCSQCSAYVPTMAPNIPSCDYAQYPVTTVVDNTLANSLANAIQLLIVSNLLESSSLTPCNSLPYSTCETANPFNVIDVVTPEYLPCNKMSCEAVATPYLEVPCYQEPIASSAPIFGQDVAFDSRINPYTNSFSCSDCGSVNSFPSGFGCTDCGLVNSFKSFGCDNSLVNPYVSFGCPDSCGLANPFANGFGCLDSIFSPAAAEVLFPAEIPAQLTCNFGYMGNNVPCVSVNVEPLPFETRSFNNGVYY